MKKTAMSAEKKEVCGVFHETKTGTVEEEKKEKTHTIHGTRGTNQGGSQGVYRRPYVSNLTKMRTTKSRWKKTTKDYLNEGKKDCGGWKRGGLFGTSLRVCRAAGPEDFIDSHNEKKTQPFLAKNPDN